MVHGAVFDEPGDGFPEGEEDEERKRVALRDWQRVLEHPDVALHTDEGGRTSLHRSDTLVVAVDDLDDARLLANLDDIGIRRDQLEEQRAIAAERDQRSVSLKLGVRWDVVAATRFLRALGGRRPLRVGPDHLLFTAQGRVLGPSSLPRPVGPPRARPEPTATTASEPVRVAVIDSGLVEHVLGTDPLLAAGSDTGDQPDPFADPSWDADTDQLRHWIGGHGTHTAGVLAASAAEQGGSVRIRHYPVTTFFSDPDLIPLVADTDLAVAVADAIRNGCRVLNLSLGGPAALDVGTLATALALDAAHSRGAGSDGTDAVIVAAAGNEATTQPMYPAAAKGVVAVGALTKLPGRSTRAAAAVRAPFSNHGPWVDCATAGVRIIGPYVTGLGGPDSAGHQFRFKGWAAWSGTSFAAPHVAGRVAAVLASGATNSARIAAAMVLADGEPLDPALGLGLLVR